MKLLHRGEKGFTLIELLVVIAILGVIAAVVALNVTGFFGRGTLQAANTELHQVQTAVVSALADAETGTLTGYGLWSGGNGTIWAVNAANVTFDASAYVYGPLRAEYDILQDGSILTGDAMIEGGWGDSIVWNSTVHSWSAA